MRHSDKCVQRRAAPVARLSGGRTGSFCDTATNRPLRNRDRLAHWAEGANYGTRVYAN